MAHAAAGAQPEAVSVSILRFGPLHLTIRMAKLRNVLLSVDLPEAPPISLSALNLAQALEVLNGMPISPSRNKPAELFANALQSVRPGQTLTYGQMAALLGTAPRAIGARCAHNALLLRIPCHRITGISGLGGFRSGLLWKTTLLALEKDSSVFPPP
jgi:O-6-methylguanine DNA methyltransferase